MGPIEEVLRDKFSHALFGGKEINTDFRKILGHSVKYGGLGIPDPWMSAESAYNTSKASSGELVDSLLGGSALKYVGHRACIRRSSLAARRERKHVELAELARQKELSGGQERNRLHRATSNGAWLIVVPHRLNGMEFLREEFWDDLRLIYGLMPQEIPATCDGCGKKFLIECTYHSQRVALFLRGTMILQRSGAPLEPGSLSLVLLPRNLKSTVGQYRGGGAWPERSRTVEQPMVAWVL